MQTHHSLNKLWPWVDLDLFKDKVKFGHLICYVGTIKIIYFSKTIADYDFNVGRCIELNDLMNQHENQTRYRMLTLCDRFSEQ